ncbi:unnamed protein product [Parascedosporium putredinis]|uniref:Uncharacterized protein n=1 Tax=Parascedosporium putredinis TaxID=1442378 RepID=A0A9P1HCA0_9PEZI|nr:unnamed protein product [Parascedosporium putredinis]CAI8004537.1 unnamed protein product [Parascedosporium putredinis]
MEPSTPSPPPSGVRTPPTPKHGFGDHWDPYSPRKSARISAQRAGNRTPASHLLSHQPRPIWPRPREEGAHPSNLRGGHGLAFESPKKRVRTSAAVDSNSFTPPQTGRLSAHSSARASSSLGLDKSSTLQTSSTTISRVAGMIPTPAKTPKKAPVEKNAGIQAIARNLFASDEEIMPSPSKARAKKYTGISLESFTAEEDETPIEIFTDSKERIPNKEVSADNPFYGNASRDAQEPVKRRSKRNKVHVPGEGRQTIEDAMGREDGLVYVFRGKRIFRKFAEADPADAEALEDGEEPSMRRMTRSTMKPRLLFPTKPQEPSELEAEEADTDVELGPEDMETTEAPDTPVTKKEERPTTPSAPGYSPMSP